MDDDDAIHWVVEYHGKNAVEGRKFETYDSALALFKTLSWKIACCILDDSGNELKYWGSRGGRDKAMLNWLKERQRQEEEDRKKQELAEEPQIESAEDETFWTGFCCRKRYKGDVSAMKSAVKPQRKPDPQPNLSSMFCVVTKAKKNGEVRGEFYKTASIAKARFNTLPSQPSIVVAPDGEQLECWGGSADALEMKAWWQQTSKLPKERVPKQLYYEPVILNIYDVTTVQTISAVNGALRLVGSGAYHGGVEIYGREWSFGGFPPDYDIPSDQTGVFDCVPRACEMHHFHEMVFMGRTQMSKNQVDALLEKLMRKWRGIDYDLLTHNCCNFSDAFCRELGVGPIPEWVLSAARTGAHLLDSVVSAQGEGATLRGDGDGSYEFGDLTRGAVHQIVQKGSGRQGQTVSGDCCSFAHFLKGILSKRWI